MRRRWRSSAAYLSTEVASIRRCVIDPKRKIDLPLLGARRRNSNHLCRNGGGERVSRIENNCEFGLFNSIMFASPRGRTPAQNHPAKKSTTPVSRLYIAPAILIAPFDSISASTG